MPRQSSRCVYGVAYIWYMNGNLLSDGVNTHVYDSANRLVSVSGQSSVTSYQYNGLGGRLTQNGTQYVLDLNAGLTQVLNDGENSYVYGLGRISQTNTTTEYFLGDALGSVRQLSMTNGEISLAQSYDPYGNVTYTAGTSSTPYGFTGETTDANGLVYLRARYYNPADARFMSRDTWAGDYNSPLSLNRWMYVEGNPVNYADPTGHISEGYQARKADLIVEKLKSYNVHVVKDWGYQLVPDPKAFKYQPTKYHCQWQEGNWRNAKELQLTLDAVRKMAQKMGGAGKFMAAFRGQPVKVVRRLEKEKTAGEAPHPPANYIVGDVVLYNGSFRAHYSPERSMGYVVHEFVHVWDARYGYEISVEYADFINPYTTFCDRCLRIWDPNNHIKYFPTKYSKKNEIEFWAESVTVYIIPSLAELNELSSLSKGFIRKKFHNLH